MQFCKARWLQKFWTDPILLFHFQAVSKFLIDWIVCVSSTVATVVENVQMAFPFFVCHFVTRWRSRWSRQIIWPKNGLIWPNMTERCLKQIIHTSTLRNREAASKSVPCGWTASADRVPVSWDRCLAPVRGTVNPSLFSCDWFGCRGTSCHHWVRATWIWVDDSSLEAEKGLLECSKLIKTLPSAAAYMIFLARCFPNLFFVFFWARFFGLISHFLAPLRPSKESVVLLMEDILHQLKVGLSHYLQAFIHPRWSGSLPSTVVRVVSDRISPYWGHLKVNPL